MGLPHGFLEAIVIATGVLAIIVSLQGLSGGRTGQEPPESTPNIYHKVIIGFDDPDPDDPGGNGIDFCTLCPASFVELDEMDREIVFTRKSCQATKYPGNDGSSHNGYTVVRCVYRSNGGGMREITIVV